MSPALTVKDFEYEICPHVGCNWKWLVIKTSSASKDIHRIAFFGHLDKAHDGKVPPTASGINWNKFFGDFA